MCINDFAFACAIDNSPSYFTYEGETMMIINSQEYAKLGESDFHIVEPHMEALISHESIHVVLKKLVNQEVSDALDDIEVIVTHKGLKFQVTLNNLAFARDMSGIVTPW
ncbi:MAG: hypothetical protein HMLIMOIP_000354 [Candidatus Nitrosomirales archaeon]|jgi:hypothetical protein